MYPNFTENAELFTYFSKYNLIAWPGKCSKICSASEQHIRHTRDQAGHNPCNILTLTHYRENIGKSAKHYINGLNNNAKPSRKHYCRRPSLSPCIELPDWTEAPIRGEPATSRRFILSTATAFYGTEINDIDVVLAIAMNGARSHLGTIDDCPAT